MNSRIRNFLIFVLGLLVGLNWWKIQKGTSNSWHKLRVWLEGQKRKVEPASQQSSPPAETELPPTESEKSIEAIIAEKPAEKKEEWPEPLTVEKIVKAREAKEEDKGKVKITIKEDSR